MTHWSSRLLAVRLKISASTVSRARRDYVVQPWRAQSFRFSTDPELAGKVTDVVGLCLAPPENAIVLCVDEKSQIQTAATPSSGPRLPRTSSRTPTVDRLKCAALGQKRSGARGSSRPILIAETSAWARLATPSFW